MKEAAFYWCRKELARRVSEGPVSFVPVHAGEEDRENEGAGGGRNGESSQACLACQSGRGIMAISR